MVGNLPLKITIYCHILRYVILITNKPNTVFFAFIIYNLTELVCAQNDPCLNGGTCNEVDGFTTMCNCPDDYTGDNCQTGVVLTLFDPVW